MIAKILRIVLPIVLLAGGAVGLRVLLKLKPRADRRPPAYAGELVEVHQVHRADRPLTIRAHGTVRAAEEVVLMSQVGGRIVALEPGMEAGAVLREGQLLVRIDDRDYELTVADRRAQVSRAEQELELEKGRRAIAAREWELVGPTGGANEAARARALRDPQIKSADASVAAARAGLAMARLNVERTRLVAPFDAMVLSESVEEGQVVSPGTQLARLVGTRAARVEVTVQAGDLAWISVPGAPATVTWGTSSGQVERQGRVSRLLGELEPTGSLARLVIEVPDPFGLEGSGPPLLLGAFVDVAIEGRPQRAVVELARPALREGDRVFTVQSVPQAAVKDLGRRMVWTYLQRDLPGAQGLGQAVAPLQDGPERAAGRAAVLAALAHAPAASPERLEAALAAAEQPLELLAINPVKVVRRLKDSVLVSEGLEDGATVITSRLATPVSGQKLRRKAEPADGARP